MARETPWTETLKNYPEKIDHFTGSGKLRAVKTTLSENMKAQRQPPEAVFQLLYGRSRGDGVIAVGAKRPNTRGDIAIRYFLPLSVTNWQPLLPGILRFHPEWTKYFAPNTLDRRALMGRELPEFVDKVNRTDGAVPLKFNSNNANVRELTSVWVDLDVYKHPDGLTNADAFGIVMAKFARGELPWPSLSAFSGRGSYYLWLLCEEGSIEPPLVTDVNAHMWRQVIDETVRRTSDIESDPAAKSMSRWLKLPGTVDDKTGEEVWYQTMGAGAPQNVPVYTLRELTDFYGLMPTLPDGQREMLPVNVMTKMRPAKKAKSGRPRCGGDPAGPYRARYQDMERLAQHRGGIKKGFRSTRVLSYFFAVRAAFRMSLDIESAYEKARERTAEFNKKYCLPPLKQNDLAKCTPRRRNKREAAVAHLGRVWKVCDEEVRELELVAIVPPHIREERTRAKRERGRAKRERREQIDTYIQEGKTNAEIFRYIPRQYRYTVSRRRKALSVPVNTRQEKLL